MEFPRHHQHGHRYDGDDDDAADDRRRPPSHARQDADPYAYGQAAPPPYGRAPDHADPYARPPPPAYGHAPGPGDSYGRAPDHADPYSRPPPPAYGHAPAPGDSYGRHPPPPAYGRDDDYAPPPAYGAGGYGNVVHVSHEVGDDRPRPHYGGAGSDYAHETRPHHGGGVAPPVRQQTFRILCKAGEENYSLAVRDGKAILVRTDRDDDAQVLQNDIDEEEENHDDADADADDDGQMRELEKEYHTLQADHQTILMTLKQHRDDDATRGQAVKNQKALWDKTLETRFLLQKAFSTSNKLPKEPIKSRFCDQDKEVEKAYADLLDSSKQTLCCMLDLQEALLERNQAAKGANEMSSDPNGENDEWSEVQKLQRRITPFRNSEIDKWQRKTQVTTGAAALKGKLHAFNQNISDQVTGYMRDPSRMINRMYLRKSTVGVFGEDVGEPGTTKEEHNLEGDPELIDDSEFYQHLLKEFLESCDTGGSESAFYALRKQQHKKRKLVDRRASKSRKIRYHVHEKIANFMAPVPMVLPPMAPKLFENLFGMGNQKPTTV